MRTCTAPRWLIFFAVALAPAVAAAQQAGSLISPHTAPLIVDEPRAFPASAIQEAQPLRSSFPQAARRVQPPVNVRLLSAEEAIANQAPKPPLRLSPRSEASRPHSQKPSAPTPAAALTTVGGSLALVLGLF